MDINYKIVCAGSNSFGNNMPDTLDDVIEDVGILSHDEILCLLKGCDGVLIPSRHEQCSYVGIESMMFGKEIFIFGGYGICNMFDLNNSHKIKDPEDLMKSFDEKRGEAGRMDFLRYYSAPEFRKSYLRLFRSFKRF